MRRPEEVESDGADRIGEAGGSRRRRAALPRMPDPAGTLWQALAPAWIGAGAAGADPPRRRAAGRPPARDRGDGPL